MSVWAGHGLLSGGGKNSAHSSEAAELTRFGLAAGREVGS